MNGAGPRVPTEESRRGSLALASVVVWLAAAALAGPLGILPAVGGTALALGIAVLLFDPAAATALLRPSPGLLLLGAGAGGLMAAATFLLYPVLAGLVPFVAADTARLCGAFWAPSPLLASVAIAPVIVGEELVWRGVVQASLVRRVGIWRGVTMAAVVYALAQAPLGSWVLGAVAFCCGLAWGTLRATTASLVPSIVAHLLWDMLALLWLPLR
jgi:membrane protease YdiL (CAAX protease family)